MPRIVLDTADLRPIWAMPEWVPERLGSVLPDGWEVVLPGVPADGSGDGAARVTPELLDAVSDATIYFGFGVPEALLKAGKQLEWVHSAAAGVGGSLSPTMLASPVVFTNSAGIHAIPMAETVLAMILHFARGLDFAVEGKLRHEWWLDPFFAADAPLFELGDATVGVVGYGGIGREVARRVAGLGSRVLALKRRPPSADDAKLETVAGGGSLEGQIEVVEGRSGFERLLRESDVVVVSAPETPETRGMIDEEALSQMRPGALLINVARGSLVDEASLVEALRRGRVRGAGLDVFREEPLPAEHPLWDLPNVVITPHVSGITRGFWKREVQLIERNLERYLSGAPVEEWENVVDKKAGY